MRLRLVRHPQPTATLGDLYVDGIWNCHTLEDIDRYLEAGGTKIPHDTAIPLGTYPVIIDLSTRFGRAMLHVLNVPQFAGIRIHAGNTTADTEGCILVGEDIDRDVLVRSKAALEPLFHEVSAAIDRGETVELTVDREP